jgi:hypothetical protein
MSQAMSQSINDSQRKARRTLSLLAVVFLGPMVVAVVLYYTDFRWRPSGTTQHGVLYQPPRPLPDVAMAIVDAAGGNATLRGKWTLIYIGPGDCQAPCRAALDAMRQVRRALGRDMDRVQRLYVVTAGTADTSFLTQEHSGIGIVADSRAAHDLAGQTGQADQGGAGDIFLTDPLGNLVMRYPAGTTMKGIYGDLKHLLTVSTIG